MSAHTRRSVLIGAAAVGAALAVPAITRLVGSTAPDVGNSAYSGRVPVTREDHRVIVIGSGFGGGVTTLRLAQAGIPVVLLERGRWWNTGPNASTFPNPAAVDKRFFWYQTNAQLFGNTAPVEPYAGLLEAVAGDNMTALCAAGVGGGSLVYQGMTLEPAEAVFNTHFPPQLDWATMHRVHYPRVAKMLKIAVAPDPLIESPNYQVARLFADHARRAGMPVSKIPMPIDWDYALAELRGTMAASYTNGNGALGVNNGGKHSVDVTYIAQAMATGRVDVRTLHHVTDVERAKDGRWVVHIDRTDASGALVENLILTTKALVMSAGSLNTTKLLLRAAHKGLIPNMPDRLGQGWGSNADRIMVWTNLAEHFNLPQGGPVVYGSLNWQDPATAYTLIQASIPPSPVDTRSTMLVGYGVSADRGRFVYDSAGDDAKLQWPKTGDAFIQNQYIIPAAHRVVGAGGTITDTNTFFNTTWHPVGGANMGPVCDLDGRVHGQPGLYVIDGALLPGNSAACNPSMTIAAVAERALDNIVAHDIGTLI